MNLGSNFNKDKILSTLNNFFQGAQKFAGDSFESAKRFGGGSVHFVSEKFNGFSEGVSESFEEFQKIMLKNFEEFQKFDRKKQIIIGLIAVLGFGSIVGLIVGGVYFVKKNKAEAVKKAQEEEARLAQEDKLLQDWLSEFPVDEEAGQTLVLNQNLIINPKEFITNLLTSLTNENKKIFLNFLKKKYNLNLVNQDNITDQEALQIINIIQKEGTRKILLNLMKNSSYSQLDLEQNRLLFLLNSISQIDLNQKNNQLTGGDEEILALTPKPITGAATPTAEDLTEGKFSIDYAKEEEEILKLLAQEQQLKSFNQKKFAIYKEILSNKEEEEILKLLAQEQQLKSFNQKKFAIYKEILSNFELFILLIKSKKQIFGDNFEISNQEFNEKNKKFESKFTEFKNFEKTEQNNETDLVNYLNSVTEPKTFEEKIYKQMKEVVNLIDLTIQGINGKFKNVKKTFSFFNKPENKTEKQANFDEVKKLLINFKNTLGEINKKYNKDDKDESKTNIKFELQNTEVVKFLSENQKKK